MRTNMWSPTYRKCKMVAKVIIIVFVVCVVWAVKRTIVMCSFTKTFSHVLFSMRLLYAFTNVIWIRKIILLIRNCNHQITIRLRARTMKICNDWRRCVFSEPINLFSFVLEHSAISLSFCLLFQIHPSRIWCIIRWLSTNVCIHGVLAVNVAPIVFSLSLSPFWRFKCCAFRMVHTE